MSLHKLTAGDGYAYLTRQVAAQDTTERGYRNLGDYYAQRGEAPGVWVGRGLIGLSDQFPGFDPQRPVAEAQMVALFGEGRHPDAEVMGRRLVAGGGSVRAALDASRLGTRFPVRDGTTEFRLRVAREFGEYNSALGFPRDWPVPAEERARIRTQVADAMFAERYGRAPLDPRERAGFIAVVSRQRTTAVAGYDLTFSPVKSVSALWAIAPFDVMRTVEAAHHAAVRDAIAWLEDHGTYTRTGRGGVRQVDARGLIAVAFTHRDSRAGDPDLHTHVAISNKVQTRDDGRWLALDGRPIHELAVAASERYNTRLEAEVSARLGVAFAPRNGGDPTRRPVRELIGLGGGPGPSAGEPDADGLLRRWSSRRRTIEARRELLARKFEAEHGRPPTAVESIRLAQQATLETREAKHAPRTHAEQRAAWNLQAVSVLGGEEQLQAVVARVLRAGAPEAAQQTPHRIRGRTAAEEPEAARLERAARSILATVQASRATWRASHVRAEAERWARGVNTPRERVDATVDEVAARTIALCAPLGYAEPVTEPPPLRRRDGTSVYVVAGSQLYTSAEVVDAERYLLGVAGRRDGWTETAASVDIAVAESSASGMALNPGQVHVVRELAISGARLQLALAPAGTGKTTAMSVLSRVWRASGGTVVGLAPSAAAAAVLRHELDAPTDTLAKLTHSLGAHGPIPDWVTGMDARTLVVIDEAGMAGTTELAAAVRYVVERGGSVRLIGDGQQLAAIGAGGALRDIAEVHGAVTLSQVVRFADPAEGAASLALREGDVAALGFYFDSGRVHVGDHATATDQAFMAWSADRAAGLDAVMLAPTRDLVIDLNARAQTGRLLAEPAPKGSPGVSLADGAVAWMGDVVISRRNERRLRLSASDWVKNGDRWRVDHVHPDGSVDVTHLSLRRRLRLPADYATRHLALGYATTIHGAQGITADTSHVVALGSETRQLLYVAMTRGRRSNHVYVAVAPDGDDHLVITRDALLPPTTGDVLARILARDGVQTSATTTARLLTSAQRRLRDAAARYHDAVLMAAQHRLGDDGMRAIDQAGEAIRTGLTDQPAWPVLRAQLAYLAVDGADPVAALRNAVGLRELDSARDAAAVLDWRLDPSGSHGNTGRGPLPWLPGIPAGLRDDAQWSGYLARRADLVSTAAIEIRDSTRTWSSATAPAWAAPLLDTDASDGLIADLAIWRAVLDVPDNDRRATGPPPNLAGDSERTATTAAEIRQQHALDAQVNAVLGDPAALAQRWALVVRQIDHRITQDPFWPELADRLDDAYRAGADIPALLHTTAGRPLPDEHPAAALWWRITHHLAPAASAGTRSPELRPHWTPEFLAIVGSVAAQRVMHDREWPALVATVTVACRDHGWTPSTLLSTAYELLDAAQPDDDPIRPADLATALAWRISLLTDPDLPHAASPPPDQLAEPPARPEPAAPPPPSGVPLERVLELNAAALSYYESRRANSWVDAYLRERLGTELADDLAHSTFTAGWAPAGWDTLTRHLRARGATDDELLAAGLSTRARTGRLIDRFRDRLVLPIHGSGGIHGFIARAHPDDATSPKYLNTPDTIAFRKGDHVYGLTEGAQQLAAGARPVHVEGPLDAIAVTLAGRGAFVGAAPLGTALTEHQADRILDALPDRETGVIVGTDADEAGRAAADRAFWTYTDRRIDPARLDLPDGLDPADVARDLGPTELRRRLENPDDLARHLIDRTVDAFANRLHTVEGRVFATRAAAPYIVLLPPARWLSLVSHVASRTGVAHATAALEVVEASQPSGARSAAPVPSEPAKPYAGPVAGGRQRPRIPPPTARPR